MKGASDIEFKKARLHDLEKSNKSFLQKWLCPATIGGNSLAAYSVLLALGVSGAPLAIGTAAFGLSGYFSLKLFGIFSALASDAPESRMEEISRLRAEINNFSGEPVCGKSNSWGLVQACVDLHVVKSLPVLLSQEAKIPIEQYVEYCKAGAYDIPSAELIILNSLDIHGVDRRDVVRMSGESVENLARAAFSLYIAIRLAECAGIPRGKYPDLFLPIVSRVTRGAEKDGDSISDVLNSAIKKPFSEVSYYYSDFSPECITELTQDAWCIFREVLDQSDTKLNKDLFVQSAKLEFMYTPGTSLFVDSIGFSVRNLLRLYRLGVEVPGNG